jgi:hypothetical protein
MNQIQWLSLLVKMLEGETVINGDWEYAKAQAMAELQALKFVPVRLVGRQSSVDVSETTLHIIGMLADTRLNTASLTCILAYIRHDPELLASVEMSITPNEKELEKQTDTECQEENDKPAKKPRKSRQSE